MVDTSSIGAFLTWLISASGMGALVSLAADYLPATLTGGKRLGVIAVICAAVGIVVQTIIIYVPAGVLTLFQPYFTTLATFAIVLGGAKFYHSVAGKPDAVDLAPLITVHSTTETGPTLGLNKTTTTTHVESTDPAALSIALAATQPKPVG